MELPLFPLRVVLFPGRPLPLHLFEPRYRTMLADCMAGDRRFGVVAIRNGSEVGVGAEPFGIGTIAEIESVHRHADGRADVLTRGTRRFRIVRVIPDQRPYLRGEVELLPDPIVNGACADRAGRVRELLVPYLRLLGAPPEMLERLPDDPIGLAYLAASAAQVDLAEQQRLLEIDDLSERLDGVLALLRREASLVRHLGAVGSLKPVGPGGAELN